MLTCGEDVNSCSVQRRVQTHVKRFHTFACDAVGLQCWVNCLVLFGLCFAWLGLGFLVVCCLFDFCEKSGIPHRNSFHGLHLHSQVEDRQTFR